MTTAGGVLGIIEREAEESNFRATFYAVCLYRDRGTFNELSSRGPQGAKGLSSSCRYGGRLRYTWRELDAVVMPMRRRDCIWTIERMVNRHASDGRPYLSGSPNPWSGHVNGASEGAAGYRSIQTATPQASSAAKIRAARFSIMSALRILSGYRRQIFRFQSHVDRDLATTFTILGC